MEIEGDACISAEDRAGTSDFRLQPSPLEVMFAEHFMYLDYKDHLSAQMSLFTPVCLPQEVGA